MSDILANPESRVSATSGLDSRFRGNESRFESIITLFLQFGLFLLTHLRPSEVISDMDFTHRLSVSGIYELPFGKGKPFLSSANSFASRVVGGWQISGIYTYQTAAPIGGTNGWTPGNVPGSGIIFNGNFRDIVLPSSERTIQRWFNTDAGFVKAANQQRTTRQVRTFPLRF